MQFHIDVDTGDAVAGWLVPTRPDIVPTVLVSARGGNPVALRANVMRGDLAALGMHATGEVGFLVNEATIPGLNDRDELELRDGETHLIIYRRPRPGRDANLKLCRFTQGFGVQLALDRALKPHFSLAYDNCAEYPFATIFALVNNQNGKSVYASGALSYHRHHQLVTERGFLTCILLKEPADALAEMLLALQRTIGGGALPNGLMTPYLEHFAAWFAPGGDPLGDPDWLEGAFAQLTQPQHMLLGNLTVRLLACHDESPEHRHVAMALENLASFSLVGLETEFAAFRHTLAELAGTDLLDGFAMAENPAARQLAKRLAGIESVARLQSLDRALYQHARTAISGALAVRPF